MYNFYNSNNQMQYILHFPDLYNNGLKKYFYDEVAQLREPVISKKISIVSISNLDCILQSPLYRQIPQTHKLYTDDDYIKIESKDWNNLLKIDGILNVLKHVETEYCLITDLADVLIVNDLDDKFINKFNSLGYDVVFNGQSTKFPLMQVENLLDILTNTNDVKYLNAGVCFGKTQALLDFYTYVNYIKSTTKPSNTWRDNKPSEQYYVRLAKEKYKGYKIGIDDNRLLFTVCLDQEVDFEKVNNDKIIIKMKGK